MKIIEAKALPNFRLNLRFDNGESGVESANGSNGVAGTNGKAGKNGTASDNPACI